MSSSLQNLVLLFNTLRYLKATQVYYRFKRKLHKPKVGVKQAKVASMPASSWVHIELYQEKISQDLETNFLNVRKALNLPRDWESEIPSKLWLYNLHYFEDLLSFGSSLKFEFHQQLLLKWVNDNPVGKGNAWEPYPTSLRIVNVLKAWMGGLPLPDSILTSLFQQADYLSNDLEKHLLGNHYFVNLKALLFAGVVFNEPAWREIAESGLLSEVEEQILEDGANFELSPMYHSLMIVDMLDMFNLVFAYPGKVSKVLEGLLRTTIPKMLDFQDYISHPDGEPSFFNDSALSIAPSRFSINKYASLLGFSGGSQDNYDLKKTVSGYLCPRVGRAKLLFDAAEVGPDYIPGHAHADTLSFEFSLGSQRVFVNSGTSQYGLSEERLRQRSTPAHNTVVVDDCNSSQVWSGFRVAKRARIVRRYLNEPSQEGEVTLSATHNGYKKMFGGVLHERLIRFSSDKLIILDRLHGRFSKAFSRLHLHPSIRAALKGDAVELVGEGFKAVIKTSDSGVSILPATWHPEFGVVLDNFVVEIPFLSPELRVEVNWVFN